MHVKHLKHLSVFFGTIFSAVLASICCLGPLVLAIFGLGGLGIFTFLENYRVLFISITFIFLGIAFYFTYRRRKPADVCCDINEVKKRDRIKKIVLWIITIAAIGLILFPYAYGTFYRLYTVAPVSNDLKKIVITVEDMDCEACAQSIIATLSKIEGVKDVSINVERREVIVGIDINIRDVPVQRLLTSIKDLGYKPSMNTESPIQNK